MSNNKLLGGILIVSGTTIGGGMLALPLTSAFAGFSLSLIVLIGMWALMTYTALITLEMNLHFKKGVSISYAAEYFLGKPGKIISTLAIGLLFYALLSAYMAGGASIFNQLVNHLFKWELSSTALILIFGMIFSGIIAARTKIVDNVNRWLLIIKSVCFIAITAAILPNVETTLLTHVPDTIMSYMPLLIPLFFTSFGFHGSIPTIVNYLGPDAQKLRFAFIFGSFIPLIVYVIWEVLALGVIPLEGPNSFAEVQAAGGDVGLFTTNLSKIAGGGWIVLACQGFTFLAITTSFLGVGLGLFDFMEEQLTHNDKKPSRYITALFTFAIPFVFALFYPQGFIMALGYAAIALSILAIIIPILIVWKIRAHSTNKSPITFGSQGSLILAFLCGCGIILLELSFVLS